MPRHTHPDRERKRRRSRAVKKRQAARPSGPAPKARATPSRCDECAQRDGLQQYDVTPHDRAGQPLLRRGRSRTITLCGTCLRDRGASWRWRWRLTGRELDSEASP